MTTSRTGGFLAAVALVAACTACAPSADDLPESGSRLAPTFEPRKGHDGPHDGPQDGGPGDKPGGKHTGPGTSGGDGSSGSSTPSAKPSPRATPSSGGPSGNPTAAATPTTLRASLTDGPGDVSGLTSAPAYVDLRGATIERTGDRFRFVVETAAGLPTAQADDRTMNVVGFVDTDLDGSVDYEVWATLADSGWGTSWRNPAGARFGSDSGIDVAVSGSTLTMTFDASRFGGADRFQWSAATEYGSYEQVASGTTAQDFGPDSGGTRFPG